jgi:c-di-GMP-binding flagellar brake protein YcgR
MDPRRSEPRYERRVDLEVIVGETTYAGHTVDLSLGGLCMVLTAPLAFGQRLKLRFRLPAQRDPVEVEGEVRWSEGAAGGEQKFGVRFMGLRARDVWAVSKYLQTPATPVAS